MIVMPSICRLAVWKRPVVFFVQQDCRKAENVFVYWNPCKDLAFGKLRFAGRREKSSIKKREALIGG